jgi:tetratricopeptide (TPR) repeat protein
MGGDINIGIKEYLMYEGFSFKFVPIKNKMKSTEIGFADPEDLYNKIKNVFSWDALKRKDYFVDYQNFYTFCGVLSQRNLFVNAAKEMLKIGDKDRAVELLDMCQECVPDENYPLDITYMGFSNEYMVLDMIETYYLAGAKDKALDLSQRFMDQIFKSLEFFLEYYDQAKREFDACYNCVSYLAELSDYYDNTEFAREIRGRFNALLDIQE